MSNAASAVTAVQFSDLGAAHRWFEAIGEEYTPEIAWDDLRSALIARGAGTVGTDCAEAFVENAESLGDPLDSCRDIAADTDWAYETYAAAQSEGDGSVAQGEYDEATWDAYLAENGPRWDGTEEQWQPFVEWFLYQAGEQGLATPAQEFIDYVITQPDKVAAFAAYGITIVVPMDSTATDGGAVAVAGQSLYDEVVGELLANDKEFAELFNSDPEFQREAYQLAMEVAANG